MEFPEEMDIDDAERLVNEGEIIDFETFEEYSVARRFAEFFEEGLSGKQTQLYTQKDAEGNIAYLKGKHVVNRTGVYLVAWK